VDRQGGRAWGLFDPGGLAPLWALALLVGTDLAYILLALGTQPLWGPWMWEVYSATGGLITPTLLLNLPRLALGLLLVFGLARLRPADLGLSRCALLVGVGVLAGAWALVQALGLAQALASGRPLRLDPALRAFGGLAFLGPLLAQVLGNALHEEVVYRGALLGQAWRRALGRWPCQPSLALGVALLLSQSAFALMHLPIRLLWEGMDPARLLMNLLLMGGVGCALGLIFLVTGSLPAVVAFHALLNAPSALVDAPLPPGGSALVALLTGTLLAVLLYRRGRTRRGSPPSPALTPRPGPSGGTAG